MDLFDKKINIQIGVKDGMIISINAQFMEILNEVIQKHDKAFKGLVKR